jgi:hypothetical protein
MPGEHDDRPVETIADTDPAPEPELLSPYPPDLFEDVISEVAKEGDGLRGTLVDGLKQFESPRNLERGGTTTTLYDQANGVLDAGLAVAYESAASLDAEQFAHGVVSQVFGHLGLDPESEPLTETVTEIVAVALDEWAQRQHPLTIRP